jgi:hypothetical protein
MSSRSLTRRDSSLSGRGDIFASALVKVGTGPQQRKSRTSGTYFSASTRLHRYAYQQAMGGLGNQTKCGGGMCTKCADADGGWGVTVMGGIAQKDEGCPCRDRVRIHGGGAAAAGIEGYSAMITHRQ